MNILIVDDEAGALRDLFRVIKKVVPNEEIYTAREADTALKICKTVPLDVTFLDIRMADMNGLDLAKKMKQTRPLLNIVIVTAYPNYALEALHLYVSDYILKPADPEHIRRALQNLRNPINERNTGLFVQCLGFFEVFFNGKPLHFKRSKVKELFAYLIDRKGATATNAQIRAALWMDEVQDDEKQQKYFSRIVLDLKHLLEELGLSDILIHHRNAYAIVPDQIPCDYYQELKKDANFLSKYSGNYMCQYEWAYYRNHVEYVR